MMSDKWSRGLRAIWGRLLGSGKRDTSEGIGNDTRSLPPKSLDVGSATPAVVPTVATGTSQVGQSTETPPSTTPTLAASVNRALPQSRKSAEPGRAKKKVVTTEPEPASQSRAKRINSPASQQTSRPAKRAVRAEADRSGHDDVGPIQFEQVFINLGVDFGTSYTKVCFRDTGTEESFVVTFDAETLEGALLPSAVAIDKKGKLYAADEAPRGATLVRYLKMRLAGVPISNELPTIGGVDLASDRATRALACWFLAKILERSREWIIRNASDRLKNRVVVWSANVGVPVEHYDSPAIETFRDVLAVSWRWAAAGDLPKSITEAVEAYDQSIVRTKHETADFHAIPEIAAAVQSFVMSREAVPGIYVYFDIGGGTVDGVAFKFMNPNGERRVNFYSGKVTPLGISALASALGANSLQQIDERKFERLVRSGDASILSRLEQQVRQLVGYVVMKAKQTDGRNWQEDAIQILDSVRNNIRSLGGLDRSKMKPLIVFLGGGGAPAKWYRNTIASTYDKFQHHNAGIPPYHLEEVSAPKDIDLAGLASTEFRRFAISYGLSIPFGEGPEIGLPSQFTETEALQVRPLRVVGYLDSKDAYD